MSTEVHRSTSHESASRHVNGEAKYIDDLPLPKGGLHAWVVPSPHAHARITHRDGLPALLIPGVEAVLFAKDIPGSNHVGPIVHDEDLLAEEFVHYEGQPVALVIGTDREACRRGAARVRVDYEPLEPIFDISAAIAAGSFHTTPHRIARGDVGAALQASTLQFSGEVASGAQDHFYLETHVALVIPEEGGNWKVLSSTQHPTEVQSEVASVLGIGRHRVVVEVPRLGGGFGGKESQASNIAALAAVGAAHTGRPVKLWLNRHQDMVQTGKRHPFWAKYAVGFDEQARITGLQVEIYSNGGFSADLSTAVLDRALYHLDNAYFIPNLSFVGRVCKTNLPSNTAFRGFGGPQGALVIESILQEAAERLGLDACEVRRRNFYGSSPRNRAPYGQEIPSDRSARILSELTQSANYEARRLEIHSWNARSVHYKRGLAYTPVKFGISFTNAMLNQAGALVQVYADGSVQLNHGGTEMGQGLHSKMRAIAADAFGLPLDSVRVMTTSTEKVPNTSATAASSGADLNGMAVREACNVLVERLKEVAAGMLGCRPPEVSFIGGEARSSSGSVSFGDVARTAWIQRVSLSATGFYRTPGIAYDRDKGEGTPFFYYAYGAAVVEVEVCGLTGEHRVRRVDILHDVGDSLNPAIDRGQVEGAFVQGMGWLTNEDVRFDEKGRLITRGPSTYKIPAIGDVPKDFRVALLTDAAQEGSIHGSKAVGEPPLVLAIGVVMALRDAVAGFGTEKTVPKLAIPCTPEALLFAVEAARSVNS